jgi:hypothetical protein
MIIQRRVRRHRQFTTLQTKSCGSLVVGLADPQQVRKKNFPFFLSLFSKILIDFSSTGYLGDLWAYSVTSNSWKWVYGSFSVNQPTVNCSPSTPANCYPRPRAEAAMVIDRRGTLWIHGGTQISSSTIFLAPIRV